jgi:urease accessory protein
MTTHLLDSNSHKLAAADDLALNNSVVVKQMKHAPLLGTLKLQFESDNTTTRLVRREHFGPLLVQKPLYPEGPDCCHAVIVHPPGGVVGGDELRIQVNAGKNAQALLSTPGAAKWYRANGHVARQHIQIDVEAGAAVEWLPQETILFDQADVVLNNEINLHAEARFVGCEMLCFGRTASGEQFKSGRVRQRYAVRVDGKLLWLEQGTLLGGSAAMSSALGLVGHTVCASLLCVGAPPQRDLIDTVRAAIAPMAEPKAQFGATQMKSLLMVRYLGDRSEVARQVMMAAWKVLRPALLGRESTALRIWMT